MRVDRRDVTSPAERVRLEIEQLRNRVASVLVVAILVIGGPVVISFALTDFNQLLAGLLVLMLVGLVTGLVLIRRGLGRLGRPLILLALSLELVARAYYFGGVTSVPFTGWVVVVLLTSILVHRRAGWLAALVGLLVGAALFTLESQGLLPPALRADTPLTALRISGALFFIVALLAWAMNKRIEEGVRRSARAEVRNELLIDRYELAGRGARFGIWDWDKISGTVWRDPGVQDLLGEGRVAVLGSAAAYRAYIHPDDREATSNVLTQYLAGDLPEYLADYRIKQADGGWRWVRSRGRAVRDPDGEPIRVVGSIVDISDQKSLERELERRAFRDPLTGLPNRDLFLDRLRQTLAEARRSKETDFAIVFVDLDRFKVVNDSLGHAAGDQLLIQIGRRLEGALREPDTVARLGGDEFALLIKGVRDVPAARIVVNRLESRLAEPFDLGGKELFVQASIGVLMGSLEYSDPLDLLRDADLAMYSVKGEPTVSIGVFEPDMRRRMRELHDLDSALSGAIERGEIVPWFQPIVNLESGEPIGYEALARWARPGGEVLMPGQFIDRAEATGLIARLDRAVISAAAAVVAELPAPLYLSVNLSARQFHDRELAEWVEEEAARAGLPLDRLQIEITEATLLTDLADVRRTLAILTSRGVRVALDDFGTGFSSLSYLHRFDLDVLKIDLSFVQERGPAGPGPICHAIHSMATALGIQTVAEGVETEEQRQALLALGCRTAQGFLFGKAEPIPRLPAAQASAS